MSTCRPAAGEADQYIVTRARQVAGLDGIDAIREHTGEADTGMALGLALGQAQWAIRELLAIIERPDPERDERTSTG
jgi:hypothetical protein